MIRTVLITGGCGFVGHHFVEHFLKATAWHIIVLDKLTYAASGFDRLRDIDAFTAARVRVFTANLAHGVEKGIAEEIGPVDYILHLAAETHVDRSITCPMDFVEANVMGTCGILEYARWHMEQWPGRLRAVQYFSTDEVFGPALMPGLWVGEYLGPADQLRLAYLYNEWDRYNSTNPYSATKAGGEELALAYANTYRVPLFITHTMNCFGERQHPEKFIPMVMRKVLAGEEVTIHGDNKRETSGSRFYIHCRNVANGVHYLLNKYEQREKYNIVGEQEVSNLELAQAIATVLAKPLHFKIVDFHSSRPGHDLRYGLTGRKMARIGWQPPMGFMASLESTIEWTLNHPRWLWWGKEEPDYGHKTEEGAVNSRTCGVQPAE